MTARERVAAGAVRAIFGGMREATRPSVESHSRTRWLVLRSAEPAKQDSYWPS